MSITVRKQKGRLNRRFGNEQPGMVSVVGALAWLTIKPGINTEEGRKRLLRLVRQPCQGR